MLTIEGDSWDRYKKGAVQVTRDVLTDSILKLYGIPLLRFKTNGSGKKEKILEALERIMKQVY